MQTPMETTVEYRETGQSVPAGTAQGIPAQQENSIDLLQLGILLARGKRFILLSGLALGVATLLITLVMRPTYTATTKIMPPKKSVSPLSQLGALSALAGGAAGGGAASMLGLKNPDDLYIGLLQSNSVVDPLIQRFHLESVYKTKRLSDTRKDFAGNTSISSEKSSLISISVEDHDPQRAAALANGYVEELYHLMGHLAVTEAGQRRMFFEQQLEQEKDKLADAEVALAETERKTGVIEPKGQAEMTIMGIGQLRAQIAADQVQLQGLEASATEENPQVVLLKTQISGLESQLADMEKGSSTAGLQDDVEMPTSKIPTASLEYIRKMRDVKYHETLFEILSRQYEIAKVDEAKAGEIIQVVDSAQVPDRKSWPPRALLTIVAGIFGMIFATLWLVMRAVLQNVEKNPERAVLLHELRAALRWRS